MKPLHSILMRQLEKLSIDRNVAPDEYKKLFEVVSDAYTHFDEDKKLVERSLDLSSKELTELNNSMKQSLLNLQAKTDEFEKMNKLMINRELKMIELKKENQALRAKVTV